MPTNDDCQCPDTPVRYDIQPNGFPIAIFTTTQIEGWGMPELYGFRDAYQVVERPTYALSWKEERRAQSARRPMHRYSRYERFKTVLQHLMGIHGNVPPHILEACVDAEDWEEIRCVLKENRWSLYYSRIPIIMAAIGLHTSTHLLSGEAQEYARIYDRILAQFRDMDGAWASVRSELSRAYFPNLRFCAMKLMQMNGVTHLSNVPLLRTDKKIESVGVIFEHILTFIQAEEALGWLEDGESGSSDIRNN